MNSSLLRIELRRNTVLLLLPLLAVLVGLSPAWRHLSALALWPYRSFDLQTALQGAAPVFAGTAAWMAGRERRRGMSDLLATTPCSPWTRLLATWTATALWGLLFYLAVGAVVLGVTAVQATWGAPVPWPVLVGMLAMLACATLGFALGHHLPGRFTPPLVAVGVFVSFFLGFTLLDMGNKIGYLTPIYPSVAPTDSVWYADRADLGVVQALFLLGLTLICLGSLGAVGRARALRGVARGSAGVLCVAGLGLAGASVALVLSSRAADGMVRIPVFGGPAAATPLSYIPVCHAASLPVCVHPAYRPQLTETAALLNRIAVPVLGLPGAPTRAVQRPMTFSVVSNGAHHVLAFVPIDFHDPTNPPQFAQSWTGQVAVSLVADHLRVTGRLWTADKAQNVVALYLLRRAVVPFDRTEFDQGQDVSAAEHRFAALPAGARRTWLRTHYALLRQGRVRLEDLP